MTRGLWETFRDNFGTVSDFSQIVILSDKETFPTVEFKFEKTKVFSYLFPMLWRLGDEKRPKDICNLFCSHHVVFNHINKMGKERLPQFYQRRFHEGSGKEKREDTFKKLKKQRNG